MHPGWLPGTQAGRARALAGLLLLGQGLLVVTRVLDHEAPFTVGVLLVALGAALLAWPGLRGAPAPAAVPPASPPADSPTDSPANSPENFPASPPSPIRAAAVGAAGAVAAGGVLAYNGLRGSDLAPPEVAILAYGLLLLLAAARLDATLGPVRVGTLVAYSFPLVLAPMGLWALDASLERLAGAAPMQWYMRHTLVTPMAAGLGLAGYEVTTLGDTVRLAPPRGALFLTVGVVCAGLYASVLFLGVFALFAWDARTPWRRLAAYLGLGLVGLHAANVLRLILLGAVGYSWGGRALQDVHQHAGWVLFLAWTLAFWWLVLRRFEGPGGHPAGASSLR